MKDKQTPKTCEQCGADFFCGPQQDKKCWCFDFSVKAEILNELQNNFANCLCPNCLKLFESKGLEENVR